MKEAGEESSKVGSPNFRWYRYTLGYITASVVLLSTAVLPYTTVQAIHYHRSLKKDLCDLILLELIQPIPDGLFH
eukprot:scaffold24048_cov194-Amphora_coffeaeformis.AAC.12